MSVDVWGKYLIPLLFLYFAWRFLRRPAPFGDRDGFTAGRARESEEIWKFVQRAAGLYCLAASIFLAAVTYFVSACLDEARQAAVYWYQIGLEVAAIALLIPAVKLATNLKFPKK